jgi:hypothetical protein
VWNGKGELVNLTPRPALCFNPVLGAVTERPAPVRLHLGAANATGLEWGARPAFMAAAGGGALRGRGAAGDAAEVGVAAADRRLGDRRKAPGSTCSTPTSRPTRSSGWRPGSQG